MSFTRRHVIKAGAVAAAAGLLPAGFVGPAIAQGARPRLVVIGGGPGGATLAKYVARDSQGAVDVTLVEPKERFATCFHSNLYLGDFKGFDEIEHGYEQLTEGYGIKHVRQTAQAIDREAKSVRLGDGSDIAYDHLVVAPGIDLIYDSVEGYSEDVAERLPHAWQAGPQTQLLKAQLDALEDGAQIVMIAPPNPYRCPPGPYERVSMMAHVLKAKGHTRSRILILDQKDRFSKQALFMQGWQRHYTGMVEWQDPSIHGGIGAVDAASMSVETGFGPYEADLINVIPAQRAGAIAVSAGLTNETGYCPILPESMRSAIDENVTVLGDASIAGDMPKSGFSANSQAKVAANAIRAALTGSRQFPARYANTCWSLIATDDAVKVGGSYAPADGKITATETFVSQLEEDEALRRQTQEENIGWYEGIVADIFA
ncbi:NAD(P)/FAD-dependent oxidoreductase [Salinarimonas ramus]|uniref:Cytochrome c n=1 Tax=Salinarimonas ramus TaxID=690164 RepID=A0A917V6F5_9HYPH|nr:NAD(P)/FAD-dependent oxidoreductase [Salinarimonas ramus]GGK44541.1 cytochrome c [Salinarimonas ramus]